MTQLYINGYECDLSEDSLLVFSYAVTDLTEPAVVKNSYSNTVTLPGTPRNARIFGLYHINDRLQGGVYELNERTPFSIYIDGELRESGYCVLKTVTNSGTAVTYQVLLYGGLGAFLYALKANENGDTKTLADLNWMDDDVSDFTFTLNMLTLTNSAWSKSNYENHDLTSLWGIINFAYVYRGLIDGMASDKCTINEIFMHYTVESREFNRLPYSVTDDDVTYGLVEGKALAQLIEEKCCWEMAHAAYPGLYYPVLSIQAFLNAIAKATSWNVDLSYLKNTAGGDLFGDLWLTLPRLKNMDSNDTALSLTVNGSTAQSMLTITTDDEFDVNLDVVFNVSWTHVVSLPGTRYIKCASSSVLFGVMYAVVFFQAAFYDAAGTYLGVSPLYGLAHYDLRTRSAKGLAILCDITTMNFTDKNGKTVTVSESEDGGMIVWNTEPAYKQTEVIQQFSCRGASKCVINQYSVLMNKSSGVFTGTVIGTTKRTSRLLLFKQSVWTKDSLTGDLIDQPSYMGSGTATASAYSISEFPITATFNKSHLLQTSYTPADLLLSLVKMFGLYIRADAITNTITLLPRNSFYAGEKIDLSDKCRGSHSIAPVVYEQNSYVMEAEQVESKYAAEYEEKYGRVYGSQKITTGYEHDSEETKNLMDGLIFKGAVQSQVYTPYTYTVVNYLNKLYSECPPWFLDRGNTYLLAQSTNDESPETLEQSIPFTSKPVTQNPLNANFEHYDQFPGAIAAFDNDKKDLEADGVLLYNTERKNWNINLQDVDKDFLQAFPDIDGKVPWYFATTETLSFLAPAFSRFKYGDIDDYSQGITQSLEFGTPKELYMPGVTIPETASVYSRYWRAYLNDLYNKNTRVLTAKFDLSTLGRPQDLLRKFVYYNGVYWVINSISDYDLETGGTYATVELVRVQDLEAYTNGQILD